MELAVQPAAWLPVLCLYLPFHSECSSLAAKTGAMEPWAPFPETCREVRVPVAVVASHLLPAGPTFSSIPERTQAADHPHRDSPY